MKRFVFVLTAVLAMPAGAQVPAQESDKYFPQQLSANALLASCVASSLSAAGRSRQRYCLGFVSGVEEAVRLLRVRGSSGAEPPFCIPAGTSARELAGAFTRYASGRGRDLDRPSASVVLEALTSGFPCKD
jgi:hypothetical protein